jgi:hypothetical protein
MIAGHPLAEYLVRNPAEAAPAPPERRAWEPGLLISHQEAAESSALLR